MELFAARNDDIDGSGISAYRGSAGWPWLCGHFQNNDHFEDIAGGTFVFVDRNRGRIACSYGISQRPPYQSAHFILRTWGVVGTCRRNCFVPQPIVPVCCETSDSPICAEVRQEGVPGK